MSHRDSEADELDALAVEIEALPPPVAPSEFVAAWLIEAGGPVYWTGQLSGCHKWSPSSHDGVRFARQTDAEAVISWVLAGTSPRPKAIEHGWYSSAKEGAT